MEWPKDVFVLEAKDFCRESFSDGKGRHCLLSWISRSFASDTLMVVREKMCEVMGEQCVITFNDNPSISNVTLDKVWNKTMSSLGYTEGNPESVNS